ncbi:hypothetical protein SNE40_016632 [Patella caerulea]|uniref:Nephrin n=1 Tax=Patella caerulea TaxID=87958 RepID=A0AAN8PE83_PATCE
MKQWLEVYFTIFIGTIAIAINIGVGVNGQQQFSVFPSNISVIQGQTAELKCAVTNRRGSIQWTKDGFALGYDRDIPGFRRYSVIGNTEREFNLMIINTMVSDDGEFQCQVGPAANNPPISAGAYLTILVPPEMPEIIGYTNGSVVELPNTQDLLRLICVARNGRPAASIKWFRNGEPVLQNINYLTEDSDQDSKYRTAKSTITIRPRQFSDENNAFYTCEATNSAIVGGPLKTVVQISILKPPGSPEITGYTNGQVVKTNDTLQLRCTSRGGNPLGQVVWYRNDQQIDFSYVSDGNKAVNEYTFTVQSSDNNAVYRCDVSNVVTSRPITAEFRLTVHFPPKEVTITGDKLAKAGETVTLTCVSSNSNPAAVITWFAKGQSLPVASSNVEDSPEGGFITRSTVTVSLTNQDHNVIYTCQATNNALGQTVATTITLSVLYPPDPPIITGYSAGTPVIAGQVQRMRCVSSGGNPVATLKWYKESNLLEAENKVTGNIVSSQLSIITKKNDNGATYKCTASNEATSSPLDVSVTLTVYFPPSTVTIVAQPSVIRAGSTMNLTCTTASSNPHADIVWIKSGRRIAGRNQGLRDDEFGGKSAVNVLELVPTWLDHGALYGCRATNTLISQSVNDGITLNVLFKPVFSSLSLEQVDIIEDQSKSLNYTVHANPTEVTYTLYREGIKLNIASVSRFNLALGVLNITAIKKADKGNYSMEARNSEGTTTLNFTINVRYPPSITRITDTVMEDEGGTAFFECIADANPLVPNMVRWTRENYDMSKTKVTYENGKGYLTVYDLDKADTGEFICTADNRIGSEVTKTAQLTVKYAPEIDKSRELSKAASNKGLTGQLVCKAEGAPKVTFQWKKNGVVLDTSNNKYSITTTKTNTVQYKNILQIKDVRKADYGPYQCIAINEKGTDNFEIKLDGTSSPDAPYDIEFVNATHNSITLKWKAGFDGGLPTSFRVKYRQVDSRGFIYVDVQPPAATTFTLTGLELGHQYQLTVSAFNSLGETYQYSSITAKTSSVAPPEDISTSTLQNAEEVPIIIILVVCIVGVFLLTLNVGLILFFVRRRRKRLEDGSDTTSHTNTLELYGMNKIDNVTYPPSASDDVRSCGTCDKNIDDFYDDYPPNYDMGPDYKNDYISTNLDNRGSAYMSRPQDYMRVSPRPHTMEDDDDDGHPQQWTEDPYQVALPRKGSMQDAYYRPGTDTRPKSVTDMFDRPASRPSSRCERTPPPPPVRTSSTRLGDNLPPLPARNYGPQDLPPRYAPPPGTVDALSPNIVSNPHYNGPDAQQAAQRVHTEPRMRGHLV